MSKSTIRSVDKGARRVVADLNKKNSVVRVGVLGTKGAEPKKGADGKTSSTVAEIASYLHEGTPHMPARPFISIWFDENEAENIAFAKRLAAERIAGRLDVDRSLKIMGVRAVGGIQKRLVSGPFAVLSGETLERKAPKTKPLINTGQLRSSITSVVIL